MKQYILFAAIILLGSCQDIFHEIDNPYLSIDTYEEKIDVLNGVYSRLARIHDENYFALISRSDDVNHFLDYPSCGYAYGSFNYREHSGNLYLNLYTAIININRLLTVVSFEQEKALMGELYFLRSYAYFKLARFYGTPPIILNTNVNYDVPKPTFSDVYNQIEEDMLNALDLLPESYSESRIQGETPHKGTAKAMLAEIYLNMAGYPLHDENKYKQAAELAKEVIEQSDMYNYKLLHDYADLWKEKNTHTTEYVFGLFFNAESKSCHNSLVIANGGGSTNGSNWVTSSLYHPEFKFYNDFPNNYRKYNSFVIGHYVPTTMESTDTIIHSVRFLSFDPLIEPCEYATKAGCLKWIYGGFDKEEKEFSIEKKGSTIYLLRFAQVLLTYAEAKARSGEPDQLAFDVVNQIRRRANNVDLYSPSEFDLPTSLTNEQFVDSVVWERAWELTMEPDTRWFDIIRLDLKDEIEANRYEGDNHTIVPDKYLTSEWYYYKIPQEDRWHNPNLE